MPDQGQYQRERANIPRAMVVLLRSHKDEAESPILACECASNPNDAPISIQCVKSNEAPNSQCQKNQDQCRRDDKDCARFFDVWLCRPTCSGRILSRRLDRRC